MFTVPEQFSGVARANLESQLAVLTALTSKAFENLEKVADLNINAAKASIEDSASVARQLLSARDGQELITVATAQAQPTAAKAIAYTRQLAGIAASAQVELARAAEEQFAETSRKLAELVDDVAKNAPPGSENVVSIMKTAIGTANAGYEQLSKSTKQAVEVMEANMNTAVSQFAQAAEKTTTRARAAAR
ncbi:MAG TPA: TIGR01841 family phasin [Noviherbaspirillum sp.]|nr:TIGR01841 family phasin [Noviherbaspirillum sp.]